MNLREALDTPIAWFYRGKIRYPKGHAGENLPVEYNGDRCGCTVWSDTEDALYIFTLVPPNTYKAWMSHPYLKYSHGCVIYKDSARWGFSFYEDGVIKNFGSSGRSIPWTHVCNKPIDTGIISGCTSGTCEHPNNLNGFTFHNSEYSTSYGISWSYPGAHPNSYEPKHISVTCQPETRTGLFTRIMPLITRYCSLVNNVTINNIKPDILIQDGKTLIYVNPERETSFVIPDVTCSGGSEGGKYSISCRHSYYNSYNTPQWYCDPASLFIGTAYWRTRVHSRYDDKQRSVPVWVATGLGNLVEMGTIFTDAVKHVIDTANIIDFDVKSMIDKSWLPRWLVGVMTDTDSVNQQSCARTVDFSDHGLDAVAVCQLYNLSSDFESQARKFNKKQLVRLNTCLKKNGITELLDTSAECVFNTTKLPDDIDFRALSDEVFEHIFIDNFETLQRVSRWHFNDCLDRVCILRSNVKKLANLQAMLNYFTKLINEQGINFRDWEVADYWQLVVDCRDLRGFDAAEYTVFPDTTKLPLLHNRLTRIRNDNRDEIARKQAEELNIKFKAEMAQKTYLEFESDKYIMSLPTCTDDLQDEGAVLHHCVGSYCGSVADGRETIVFLRNKKNPDVPFLTVDVTPDGDIRQIHGKYNCNVDSCEDSEEIWKFVEDWCEAKHLNKNSLKGCGRVCCHL